jgi:hypothetical protein
MSAASGEFVNIVSGLPRSGTSMMMRMISEGGIPPLVDNIRTADEDNPKGYFEFEPVKKTKEDASWLNDAPGKVVKMVYRLLYDLPDGHRYRVVFMKRKLEEVIASQNVMLERRGKGGGGLSDDAFIATFRKEIEKVEHWLADDPNFEVLYVNYNDMLSNPEPLVGQVNAFFGGELDADKMMNVVDPNLYRQRK